MAPGLHEVRIQLHVAIEAFPSAATHLNHGLLCDRCAITTHCSAQAEVARRLLWPRVADVKTPAAHKWTICRAHYAPPWRQPISAAVTRSIYHGASTKLIDETPVLR